MTDQVHNVTNLPKDAPRNDNAEPAEEATPGLWSRTKSKLSSPKLKLFLVGVGIGAATTAGAVAVVKAQSEDEGDDGNGNPVDIP